MSIKTTKHLAEANVQTHAGVFHCDEVMATVVLGKIWESYGRDLTVYRNNNVKGAQLLFTYDTGHGPYDHHQKGGNGARDNEIPYSSLGLIWADFGLDVCLYEANGNESLAKALWARVDTGLVQGIDAIDTGYFKSKREKGEPLNITSIISSFNLNWDEGMDNDQAFVRACEFAQVVFDNFVHRTLGSLQARECVIEGIKASQGGVMILDQFVPWLDHVFGFNNDKEMAKKVEDLKYVVFPTNRCPWQWRVMPDAPGSFGMRVSAPEEILGMSGEELQTKIGIPDASFIHPNGFTGGADSKEGCLAFVEYLLKNGKFNQ